MKVHDLNKRRTDNDRMKIVTKVMDVHTFANVNCEPLCLVTFNLVGRDVDWRLEAERSNHTEGLLVSTA